MSEKKKRWKSIVHGSAVAPPRGICCLCRSSKARAICDERVTATTP